MEKTKLILRPCPVCGNDSTDLGATDKPTSDAVSAAPPQASDFIGRDRVNAQAQLWAHCGKCGLEYVPRAPVESWYLEQYRQARLTDSGLDEQAAKTALGLWDDLPTQDIKSVLEWGSGRGSFLKKLHDRGVRVVGIEPNEKLRKASEVQSLDPDELKILGPERFEALVLQLSTEHLYHPQAVLQQSLKHLTGSAIVMIQYHDAGGFFHQLMGKSSPLYDLQHLQIFRAEDMERLLWESGFNKAADESYTNTYPLEYWARLAGVDKFMPGVLGKFEMPIPAGNRCFFGRRSAGTKPAL